MNLIYLSYWGVNEGLTRSSILPHLEILAKKEWVDQILFLTIERNPLDSLQCPQITKVQFIPLKSRNFKVGLLNKINDFRIFTKQISQLVERYHVDHLLCRTSLSGSLGYLVHKKMSVPYSVESFEPHADYMLEAGVWSRWGLKYQFQCYWEKKIMSSAHSIVTVSKHFTSHIKSHVLGSLYTFGCAVDLDKFKFSESKRQTIRTTLSIRPDEVVGIYVGKFGDIYYDKEAFQIIRRCFELIPNFRMIILTPHDRQWVANRLLEHSIDLTGCTIDLVPYNLVPGFLSASDFAISTVRPAPVRLYCSPIKNGEYWANGLSIMSPPDVGEDSVIIEEEKVGAVFKPDFSNLDMAIKSMVESFTRENNQGRARAVAEKYRNFSQLTSLYDQLFQ